MENNDTLINLSKQTEFLVDMGSHIESLINSVSAAKPSGERSTLDGYEQFMLWYDVHCLVTGLSQEIVRMTDRRLKEQIKLLSSGNNG